MVPGRQGPTARRLCPGTPSPPTSGGSCGFGGDIEGLTAGRCRSQRICQRQFERLKLPEPDAHLLRGRQGRGSAPGSERSLALQSGHLRQREVGP